MQLRDTHCLVTGASRGIGAAIARALAAKGARLTLVARSNESLAGICKELDARPLPADLADPAHTAGLIDRAEALGGPLGVLVNNAGIEVSTPFAATSAEDVARIYAINLVAPVELCRQVVPRFIERGGRIVNVSSMAANAGFPGMSTYCSTKAGLSHFGRLLRYELRGTQVGLTTVEVGPVPTDMLDGLTYPPIADSFARLRRIGTMPNVSADSLAAAVATAVERDRPHVWRPRRAMLFPALTSLPQRIVEPLLRGVSR